MTALQDWLSIRQFDPRNHMKAFICALRGEIGDERRPGAEETGGEPVLLRRGVERC